MDRIAHLEARIVGAPVTVDIAQVETYSPVEQLVPGRQVWQAGSQNRIVECVVALGDAIPGDSQIAVPKKRIDVARAGICRLLMRSAALFDIRTVLRCGPEASGIC